jgi:hypothetical protein
MEERCLGFFENSDSYKIDIYKCEKNILYGTDNQIRKNAG